MLNTICSIKTTPADWGAYKSDKISFHSIKRNLILFLFILIYKTPVDIKQIHNDIKQSALRESAWHTQSKVKEKRRDRKQDVHQKVRAQIKIVRVSSAHTRICASWHCAPVAKPEGKTNELLCSLRTNDALSNQMDNEQYWTRYTESKGKDEWHYTYRHVFISKQ